MFLCLWLMLLLVVGWITATHCSGASPSSIYANYSASKTVQPELYQTGILLHIFLPTAVLILPGAVKVVAISLSFYTSVHKSVKQFGNSFAFDAPTMWNALPDKSRASPSLASLRKQLKSYLYSKHTHLSLDHSLGILRGAWPLLCPWILKFC